MPAKKNVRNVKQAKKNSEPLASRLLNLPVVLSLGMYSFAEEQLSDLFESLTKRGTKTQKAGQKYLKKLMKTGSEKTKKAEQKVEKKVEKAEPKEEWILRALHRLNIPTSTDIAALDKRVDALLRKVA
jgi:poly(hydroxyalkanoate) granule-associated protein